MPDFPPSIWLLLTFAATFGVLGVLYQLAVVVRNDLLAHDLKIRVVRLRADQAIRLREINESAKHGGKDKGKHPPKSRH